MTQAKDEWRAGWTVVMAAVVCMSMVAVPTYTMGIFVPEMIREFGWTRAQANAAMTILSCGSAIGSPFVGRAIDHFGARRIGLTGIVLSTFAIGSIGLIVTSNYISFLAAWVLAALVLLPAGAVTWVMGVASRFEAQRGLALAIAWCGTSIMGGIAAPFSRLLIDAYGWRLSYAILAFTFGAISLLLAGLFFRDARDVATRADHKGILALSGLRFTEALRARRFWQLAAALLLTGGGVIGILVHLAPIFVARGITPLMAASLLSVTAAASVAARIGTGALLDRVFGPYLATGVFLSAIAGLILLLIGPHSLPIAILAAILFGVVVGGEIDIVTYITSRYFGMRAYGAIYGTLFGIFAVGQAVAPVFIGYTVDVSGSYAIGLISAATGFGLGAILIATLGPYPHFAPASDKEQFDGSGSGLAVPAK